MTSRSAQLLGKPSARPACGRWLPLFAAVGLLAGCKPAPVTVTSSPPGATVWRGDEILGPTPVELVLSKEGSVALRVCKPSYEDALVRLERSSPPPRNMLHVELRKPRGVSIQCSSIPTGAEIYLDGEHRGVTPLELTGLEPRMYEVVFRLKGRRQATQTVDLSDATGPRAVEAELASLTEAYYLQQIKKEPDAMQNYVDLAHHYVLEHRFQEAVDTFAAGVELVVKNPGISDAARLWSEIDRVIARQYDYGTAEDVEKAKQVLEEGLSKLLVKHRGKAPLMLYVCQINVLDATNQRQRAQETFEEAWRKFPNEKYLIRLRKQKRFAFP